MILDLLQKVCNSLDENNIPYMISGSIALNIKAKNKCLTLRIYC